MVALKPILALTTWLASVFNVEKMERVAFHNPTLGGGSMLDNAMNGYGEPLNVGPFPLLLMIPCLLTWTLVLAGYHLG